MMLVLLLVAQPVGAQPTALDSRPQTTDEQRTALKILNAHGGILIQLDQQRPEKPVVMVDFAGHPEFEDGWLGLVQPFTELRSLGLAKTAITDRGLALLPQLPQLTELDLADTGITSAGLSVLAGCKQLRTLSLRGTKVSPEAISALRTMLPQLTTVVAPQPPRDREWEGNRPLIPFAETDGRQEGASATPPSITRFSAAQIQDWRERLVAISQLPAQTPDGWSKSRVDPARMLTVFPELKVRPGYVLRAYIFKEDGNSNGFVWAMPADAEFPPPEACPRVESHFLMPPKPFDALDDMMEVIEGDDSPESYLHASLLRRELREFGGSWHGIQWGMHTILDTSPWSGPPPASDEPTISRPRSKQRDWRWFGPRSANWTPEVQLSPERAVVSFYSYTPLGAQVDASQSDRERILRHTDTYRRGKYRPRVSEEKLAEGPDVVAH